jgi:exopolysaccharide production protein ExoQ
VPPKIALLFCIIFVLILLWFERKQFPDLTHALWIPTIWVFYIASKPLGLWFPLSGGSLESSPLDRAFLIVLMLLALCVLIKRKFNWFSKIKENSWLVVLVVFMLVSILWSSIPEISFNRWVREFQAILMALVLLSEQAPRRALESILKRSAYVLIPFSIVLIKYFPLYGVDYGRWSGGQMWLGVTTHKNGLGRLCLIVIFFLIWSQVRRLQGKNAPVWKYQTHSEIIILLLALWLMRGPGGRSYSATSITALGVGLLIYGGLSFLRKKGKILGMGVITVSVTILIIFGIVSFFYGGSTVGFYASSAGRDATLTGRTDVWAALLPVAMQRPVLGHGFGSFWTQTTRERFNIPSAHNGYLDVLLELGLVGLFLVSMFLVSSGRKAQRQLANDFDWATLWICYLIMAIVHNIAESSINSFTSQLTAVILFLSVTSTNVIGSHDNYHEVQ